MVKKIKLNRYKRIIILNMIAKTVGDSVFITPLFRIIKNNLPKSYLAVTASPSNKDIFSNNPNLDELIYIKDLEIIGTPKISKLKKALTYAKIVLGLAFKLKKRKFDLCIIITPKFPPVYLIPKLAGIKTVVGHEFKGSKTFFLTKKVEFTDQLRYPNRHYLESSLDLLRLLGMKFTIRDKFVEKYLTEEEIARGKDILQENGIKEKDIIISFQAGAKWKSKMWPYENYGELAKLLINHNKNIKIILLGSPAEFKLNEKIKSFAPKNIINLSGKIPLGDVAYVIKLSNLIIGNDSGLMHVAASVSTPCVVIYGSTNPKHSKPLGKSKAFSIFKNDFCKPCIIDKKDCEYDYECMKIVKPEDVMKEVEKII